MFVYFIFLFRYLHFFQDCPFISEKKNEILRCLILTAIVVCLQALSITYLLSCTVRPVLLVTSIKWPSEFKSQYLLTSNTHLNGKIDLY